MFDELDPKLKATIIIMGGITGWCIGDSILSRMKARKLIKIHNEIQAAAEELVEKLTALDEINSPENTHEAQVEAAKFWTFVAEQRKWK